MTTAHHEHQEPAPLRPAISAPVKGALLMVAAIGGFYLLREHWDHVAGNWVYLLLLACPLMHVFMHHGHGGHDRQQHPDNSAPPQPPKTGEQP